MEAGGWFSLLSLCYGGLQPLTTKRCPAVSLVTLGVCSALSLSLSFFLRPCSLCVYVCLWEHRCTNMSTEDVRPRARAFIGGTLPEAKPVAPFKSRPPPGLSRLPFEHDPNSHTPPPTHF